MKLKYLCAGILACVGILALNAESKQALILHHMQGGTIAYALDDYPNVSFDGQQMIVLTDNTTETFPMSDILFWTIGMTEFGDIDEATSDVDPLIRISSGSVSITNPSGSPVSAFSLDGSLAGQSTSTTVEFNLPAGVYALVIAGKSYKIIVR